MGGNGRSSCPGRRCRWSTARPGGRSVPGRYRRARVDDLLHQGCSQVRLGGCRGPLCGTFSEPGDQRATEDDQGQEHARACGRAPCPDGGRRHRRWCWRSATPGPAPGRRSRHREQRSAPGSGESPVRSARDGGRRDRNGAAERRCPWLRPRYWRPPLDHRHVVPESSPSNERLFRTSEVS